MKESDKGCFNCALETFCYSSVTTVCKKNNYMHWTKVNKKEKIK